MKKDIYVIKAGSEKALQVANIPVAIIPGMMAGRYVTTEEDSAGHKRLRCVRPPDARVPSFAPYAVEALSGFWLHEALLERWQQKAPSLAIPGIDADSPGAIMAGILTALSDLRQAWQTDGYKLSPDDQYELSTCLANIEDQLRSQADMITGNEEQNL